MRETIEQMNYEPNEAGRNLRLGNHSQYGPDFELRSRWNWEAKQHIANRAVQCVSPSDVVILDSGSTVAGLVPYLPEGLLIFTNSLAVLQPAAKRGLTVHLAPGLYVPEMAAVFGEETEMYFRAHKATKYFLSSTRIDVRTGLYNVNRMTATVKSVTIEHANQVILLADHDKFCDAGLSTYASLSDVDLLITDYIPQPFREVIGDSGLNVIETASG